MRIKGIFVSIESRERPFVSSYEWGLDHDGSYEKEKTPPKSDDNNSFTRGNGVF